MENANQNSNLILDASVNHRPEALAHYPVIHHQPIHWGEMDAFNKNCAEIPYF